MKRKAIKRKSKRNKFGNIRVETFDGVKHASKKEAARWLFLLDQQTKGVIRDLRRQVRHPLHVCGVKIGTCIPDFEYVVCDSGKEIVEDVKSFRTARLPLFRRNKRHMMAEFGIDVIEVFNPQEPVV